MRCRMAASRPPLWQDLSMYALEDYTVARHVMVKL